jgi:hypothetical protein
MRGRSSDRRFRHLDWGAVADRPAGIRSTASRSGQLAGCVTIVAFGFRAGPIFELHQAIKIRFLHVIPVMERSSGTRIARTERAIWQRRFWGACHWPSCRSRGDLGFDGLPYRPRNVRTLADRMTARHCDAHISLPEADRCPCKDSIRPSHAEALSILAGDSIGRRPRTGAKSSQPKRKLSAGGRRDPGAPKEVRQRRKIRSRRSWRRSGCG